MSFQKIIHLLICPDCKSELDDSAHCKTCKITFKDNDGLLLNLIPRNTILSNRWILAQEKESKFWQKEYEKFTPKFSRIVNFFQKSLTRFQYLGKSFEAKTILEVGCGPYGFLTGLSHFSKQFSNKNILIGIDPLLDIYKEFKVFEYATKDVIRFSALGEILPFRNNSVDILICQNVIDHVSFPRKVLAEFRRVLKNGGNLLIDVHTINPLMTLLIPLLDKIDTPHPHHFTHRTFKTLLEKEGFHINKFSIIPTLYDHPFFKYRSNPLLFIKFLGINVFLTQSYFFCQT
ncbi:MAG: class I SAM-dependent methyltransferase [Promethearchaeota archaeon]